MYKLKTNQSIKKRFQFTATGKLLKRKAFRSHLLQKKNAKRKRQLRKVSFVNYNDKPIFIQSLPYIKLK